MRSLITPKNNSHIKTTAIRLMQEVYNATYPVRTDEPQGTAQERLEKILNNLCVLKNIRNSEERDGKFAPMAYNTARRYASEGIYNCLAQMAEQTDKSVGQVFAAALQAQVFTVNGRFVSPMDFMARGKRFACADCSKKHAAAAVGILLDAADELSVKKVYPDFKMDVADLIAVIDKLYEIPSQSRTDREIGVMHVFREHIVKQIGEKQANLMVQPLPLKACEQNVFLPRAGNQRSRA